MYGWLLESVQHFIVQECGEDIWETILREAGARNTIFSATQQYPDALMLRLACALARFITRDPNSPSTSTPVSPAPRKSSIKSKPTWRSASVHADNRTTAFKCPFTATNALKAVTKNEIEAYTSSEEIKSPSMSTDKINEDLEVEVVNTTDFNRRSLGVRYEDHRTREMLGDVIPESSVEFPKGNQENAVKECQVDNLMEKCPISIPKASPGNSSKVCPFDSLKNSVPTSPESDNSKKGSILKPVHKTSSTLALDVYKCPVDFLKEECPIRSSGKSSKICPFDSLQNSVPTSPESDNSKKGSILKPVQRANSTLALDVYKCPVESFKDDCPIGSLKASQGNSSKVSPFDSPKGSVPTSPESDNSKKGSILKPVRKTSCTLALDVYRRRGSILAPRPRLNSLTIIYGDKLNVMKEKFGTPEKAMHFFGRCFVKFFSNYGYDTMIRATGRYFCTFLQSVDNIHQRMRYTFPRMRSPSMQLTRAHRHGAELVYSSTRTGFTHYLMGQLYEIAEDIFSLKLKVSVVKETMDGSYYVAVLRLEFDNSDYVQSLMMRKNLPCELPTVPASLLLQLFPFGVLLDRRMKVLKAGDKLTAAWGGPYNRIVTTHISEILRLRKPKVPFTWDKVVCMQTMIFELELMRWRAKLPSDARRGSQGARSILLRGPIYFLEEIDSLIFLCCPIFNDLEELRQAGLYLADMNGHGLSKEMLLHGWQHLSRLELLFDKAENRSLSLEKSCRLLDQWKKRGDQLLYSMIPKGIADHLRAGKDPMGACQAFDSVTIIFCGVQLAEAGTRADVMQTAAYMNDVYSRIDRLLDTHRVYKVETVGTVYMLVSGAPERRRTHAASAASAALAISRALPVLTIGIHSGPCVACVLGRRLPRYCLVGDSVNTASRMQTTSEPGRIQISSVTSSQLPSGRFRLRRRGLIKVKGKGMMETFWLEGELEEEDQDDALEMFSSLWSDE